MTMPKDPGDVNNPSYINSTTGLITAAPTVNGALTVNRRTSLLLREDWEAGGYVPGGIAAEIAGTGGWTVTPGTTNDFAMNATPGSILGGAVCVVPAAPTANTQFSYRGHAIAPAIPVGTPYQFSFSLDYLAPAGVHAPGDQEFFVFIAEQNSAATPGWDFEVEIDSTGRVILQDFTGGVFTAPGFVTPGHHTCRCVVNWDEVLGIAAPSLITMYWDGAVGGAFTLQTNFPPVGVADRAAVIIGQNIDAQFADPMGFRFDGFRLELIGAVAAVPLGTSSPLLAGEVTNPIPVSGLSQWNVQANGGAIDPSDPAPFVACGFDAAATVALEGSANGALWFVIPPGLGGGPTNADALMGANFTVNLIRFRAALPNDWDQSGVYLDINAN